MRKRKGMKEDVLSRLREFIENEARSGAYVGRNSVSSIGQNQSLTSLLN